MRQENSTLLPSRRDFLKTGAGFVAATTAFGGLSAFGATRPELPEPSYSKLPRWRGFNLLEKFMVFNNEPFREDDFRNIADLGFNFVRLPMDYRCWIVDGDRRKFNEQTLSEIDKAVEYGEKYGIHVHMNFHRAPGYTVAQPPENPAIWTDAETLDVCCLHWRTFAKRYRGVPSRQLSFNLFNEPAGCRENDYMRVVTEIVSAIRAEDADRLISCDGLEYGTRPYFPLAELKVAQSTRGYAPMEISHYGASWVNSANFPYPTWPTVSINGLFPEPNKGGLSEAARRPATIVGPFPSGSKLRMKLGTVSVRAEIVVRADGREIFRREFVPKGGDGEWKKAVFNETYNVFQNEYDLDLIVDVPDGAKELTIANVSGDWATLSELEISYFDAAKNATAKARVDASPDWSAKSETTLKFAVENGVGAFSGGTVKDREWLRKTCVEPWKDAEKSGIGVMVGEFGAHNRTPIDVVRRWLEDQLYNWREAGWGWALWNFRGSFGIADSGREDVAYEDWRGLKLDRETLKILQKY